MVEKKCKRRTLNFYKSGTIKEGYYVEVGKEGFSSGDTVDLSRFPELESLCAGTISYDDFDRLKEKDIVVIHTKVGYCHYGEISKQLKDVYPHTVAIKNGIDETRQILKADIKSIDIFECEEE